MATDSVARAIALAAKAEKAIPGPQGEKGEDGISATIQVGTVTTGEAGTEAEVTNVGTENAAIFNFTIPKGEQGEEGVGGLETIVAGTGTSSEVFNKDDVSTNAAASPYSHAEGFGSVTADMETEGVDNSGSHAEGYYTTAKGGGAHAEGWQTYAEGYGAHAQGYGTRAVGDGAFAAGYSETIGNVEASGKGTVYFGIDEGEGTRKPEISGGAFVVSTEPFKTPETESCYINNKNIFLNTSSINQNLYTQGQNNIILQATPAKKYNTIGSNTSNSIHLFAGDDFGLSSGKNSVFIGGAGSSEYGYGITIGHTTPYTSALMSASRYGISIGAGSLKATNSGAIAFGSSYIGGRNEWRTQATGDGSIAGGSQLSSGAILSSGRGAFALGYAPQNRIESSGLGSLAFGNATNGSIISGGEGSIAIGTGCVAADANSIALGYNAQSGVAQQTALGKYNIAQDSSEETQYGLIFGNGTADARANAFTLDWQGNATFAGTVTSASGADYAEYFEWKDKNTNSEDRVGYIVTLDGDKIVKAKNGDDILGIISGCATVIGDNAEWNWQGRFERDEFGRIIYDQVEQFIDTSDPDWEPDPEKPDEEMPMTKKSLGYFPVPRENPNYDSTKAYTNRSNRPEWDTVGMMGKLYVRDDGTGTVNGYVTVSATTDGIATKSEDKTSMRVMERVNDHIIRVCFK